MEHKLTIVSLSDAHLTCVCSWTLKFTGEMTKSEAKKEYDKHEYNSFRYEWEKTHSMSPAPSLTSWKRNYR